MNRAIRLLLSYATPGRAPGGVALAIVSFAVAVATVHIASAVLAVRESRLYSAAQQRMDSEHVARTLESRLLLAEQWGAEQRYFHDVGFEPLQELRAAAPLDTTGSIEAVIAAGEDWREAMLSRRGPESLLTARRHFLDAREGLAAGAASLLSEAAEVSEHAARRSLTMGIVGALLTVAAWTAVLAALRRMFGRLRERSHFERGRVDALLAKLPAAVARFRGPDHVLDLANAAFQALWPARVRAGLSLGEIYPEFVAAGHAAILDRAFAEGIPGVAAEVPWAIERRPGEACRAWFNLTVEPVRDFGGAVTGVLVVAAEVTELVEARRRAERQPERAAQLEALAADLSRAATTGAIAQTLVEHVPPLFGAVGCEFAQGPSEVGVLKVVASLGAARPPGTVVMLGEADPLAEAARDGEASGLGPDVRERWPELPAAVCAAQARLIRAGKRIEGVLGMGFSAPRALDEDEQAALALLLRYCAQALQRAELLEAAQRARELAEDAVRSREEVSGLLDAIFASAPVGLGIWDRELRYVRVNEALAKMDGLAPEAHIGRRPVSVLRGIEHSQAVEAHLRQVLETGRPSLGVDTEFTAASGERCTWRQSCYPVRVRGDIIALGSVVEDVTERRQADAERARLVAVLEEAVRVRDEFLSIASHELKTPLTALDLHLRRLARPASEQWPEEKRRQSVQSALRSSDRLARLVTNLLDVSQVCADRLLLELESIDLSEALREIAERFDEELVRSGSHLVLAADRPVVGRWDRMRVDQIASNLLSNAIKFGGGKPIEVRLESDHAHARLIVRDSGLGIAPEDQERVFRRFERAVSSHHFGGLGLGLWIARQSATALGGRILLASTPGRGSSFAVELPLRGPGPEEAVGT